MPWLSVIKRLRFNPKPQSRKKQGSLQKQSISHNGELEHKVDEILQESKNYEKLKNSIVKENHKQFKKRKTKENKRINKSEESIKESVISEPVTQIEDITENNKDIQDSFDKTTIKTGEKIISEKTGFGWKGLGGSRLVFDDIFKEYRYEISEPQLTAEEEELKNQIINLFRENADLDVFDWDELRKKEHLENSLNKIIADNNFNLKGEPKDKIFYHIFREFIGYGKIDILMNDDGIEDISCDGHNIPIFIHHRDYESIGTNVVFNKAEELDSFVVKLSQMCGKQISVYEPIVDGKLSDCSRLQTTLAKTITKNSTFTIRRFRADPLTPTDLIANNTLSLDMAAYFWLAIEKGSSALFCGGTATGKTTMLNALSLFLPATYKIVSVEDTREINLPHKNWIAGTTRQGFSQTENNKTGKDIDMFDLIKVALRQRPKVIIVGEVRGKEAYALFQAMTTGHQSYSTFHADNIHSLIQRLESAPILLPRSLLTSLDLIIFLKSVKVRDSPTRRITNVTEIVKIDTETNRLVTMIPFHWVSEIDDRYQGNGGSRIYNKIKQQTGWNDQRLNQETKNRMEVLDWMVKKNIRSYEDFGRIVLEYSKNPEAVLTKVREEAA